MNNSSKKSIIFDYGLGRIGYVLHKEKLHEPVRPKIKLTSVPHQKLLYEKATPDLNSSVPTSDSTLNTPAHFSYFSFSYDPFLIVFASAF